MEKTSSSLCLIKGPNSKDIQFTVMEEEKSLHLVEPVIFFVILLMKKLLINFLPVSYSFSSASLLIMEQTEPVYSFEVRKTL